MRRRFHRIPPQALLVVATIVLTAGMAAGLERVREQNAEQARLVSARVQQSVERAAAPAETSTTTAPESTSTTETTVAAPPVEPTAPAEPAAGEAGRAAAATAAVASAEPAAPPPHAPPAIPTAVSRLPLGKGMWLHQLSHAGSATAVVEKAQASGLTHVYLRVGSSKMGFYGQDELNRLLPAAHAAGIKVIGWDFPYLFDPAADADRSAAAINYVTPDGHRMDGFSADIETESEGVNLTAEGALAYGARLRELVGPDYPLIATVPRPSPKRWFPFDEAVRHFDAIAPMVYWMNRDPVQDAAQALADLAPFQKPVLLIGQAYDGGPEGGPPGPPPKDALVRFMDTALSHGALGVSFWVWHHATAEHWAAVAEAKAWEIPPRDPENGGRVLYLQRVLNLLGQPVAQDGAMGPQTRTALAAVQVAFGLPGTGTLDEPTVTSLFGLRR